MTRIVGGMARGRRLAVPDTGTRPTSDRAREAVFSSIESLRGTFDGAAVLDIYAGSGALGLEAVSRGAVLVDLVESDPRAVRVIESNRDVVGGDQRAALVRVHPVTVERWLATGGAVATHGTLASHAAASYDVVFCDPPYALGADAVAPILAALARCDRLATGAVLVVERSRRDPPWTWPPEFVAIWDRHYGEAHLWVGGFEGGPVSSDSVAPC